ncbi:MAG: lysoplasmalogenase [Paracoccaceae bacterium]
MNTGVLLVSAVFAIAYGFRWNAHAPSRARTLLKTSPVLLLALMAMLAASPGLIVAGLLFSALGDFFLSREDDRSFLIGMIAFLAAHLAYIGVFLQAGTPALVLGERLPGALGLVAVAMLAILYLWPGLGAFRLPVLVYTLAILGMGLSALGLALSLPHVLALLGAGSFVLSDSLLAIGKFRPDGWVSRVRAAPGLVWFSYWGAQALIASAFRGI